MIRHHRSGRAKADKAWEGIQFSREVANFVNSIYAPVAVRAFVEQFGDRNVAYWHTDYENLVALEEIHARLIADPDYMAISAKGPDIFIEGT